MKIMITGITGTLGRAFTEHLYHDHDLFGVDHNEERVAQFKRDYPSILVKADDFDNAPLKGIDGVIHLAAMKHIDLCEQSPSGCVMNNVIRTYHLFQKARDNDVRILFMSTDKAVEPVSTYGFSKALGERLALEAGGSIVRSGNIVASSGSVFQVWEEAIKRGQPLRLTHKHMRRYFISAENLVRQAWDQFMKGEKEIIPTMDKDVTLFDLANQFLAEHGYTNYQPGFEYIGLRPGEKLEEKLRW